jgi:hypothetical protein
MSKDLVVGKIEQLTETRTVTIENTMENIKVGIDAFNDLAKSHDAHVKEVERLQKELDELNNLKLVDQHGELLLECRIGDEYYQLLLEVGLNTILERFIKEDK